MASKRKETTYNKILKEFTKLNNKLPEENKLSIQERRKIIRETLLPAYKNQPKYKFRVKKLRADILREVEKFPPKELCDLNYIDVDSEYALVEWYALDETIREVVPNCIYVKVSAGEYGETRIFNTRNYNYVSSGVNDIVENIRPDANDKSGLFIFTGIKKLRPRKRNDGTAENYYLDFVLFAAARGEQLEIIGGDDTPVDYQLPKSRVNRKKKTKVRNIIEAKIKQLKQKKDSRRRAKKTLEKNINKVLKTSKKLARAKNPSKNTRNKFITEMNHATDQLERYLKEGKLTQKQYDAALAKLLKAYED